MSIDWTHVTPGASLLGGAFIGLSAAGLYTLVGRMAGISGIIAGLLPPSRADAAWRLAFLAGLLVAPWVYGLNAPRPVIEMAADKATLVAAGLLVGIGTRWGGGCTSGHGVCGLARFSLRSLVAVLSFMVAGFLIVALIRHGGTP